MSGFEISADMLNTLNHQVGSFIAAAEEASNQAKEAVHSEVLRRANASERWVGLAEHIDTWDENDRFWIGVRGIDFVSEAFAAEYGTDEYPPDPLMRTVDALARHEVLVGSSSIGSTALRKQTAAQSVNAAESGITTPATSSDG